MLIHVHGGCYVLFPGEAGTTEAVMMAGLGHYKVIAVDYRMPPEAYFPAALDDAITAYKAVLKNTSPSNVAFFDAQYQFDDTLPETKEAFGEIAAFFGEHLGH